VGVDGEAPAPETESEDAAGDFEPDAGQRAKEGFAVLVAPGPEALEADRAESLAYFLEGCLQIGRPRAKEARGPQALADVLGRGFGDRLPVWIARAEGRIRRVAVLHRRASAQEKPNQLIENGTRTLVGVLSVTAF
jgi:hypothetical protein